MPRKLVQDDADTCRAGRSFWAESGDMRIAVALAVLAALAVAATAGAAVFVVSGAYNIAATSQHLQPVYSLLEFTMRQSVRLRAKSLTPPAAADAASVQRGAACYQRLCVQCHGGPGVAQNEIGKSMQPLPGPLVNAMQRWRPREVFWILRHGIKMSGMPAWGMRLDDQQIWDTVAFVERLPTLSPQGYADATRRGQNEPRPLGLGDNTELAGECAQHEPPPADRERTGGGVLSASEKLDASERGRLALSQYACTACHTIPGLVGSHPNVGPPLKGMASRTLIAGRIPNTPDNLVRWLREPQTIKPQTAMPAMGMTEAHARDMAAYLATLN